MYQMEKNTAEMRVVTRGAKRLKSLVNATIRHVRLRFDRLGLEVPLSWTPDNNIQDGGVYEKDLGPNTMNLHQILKSEALIQVGRRRSEANDSRAVSG